MDYLHCPIRTLIQIRTPNPMATLHYAVFTLHRVRFRFKSELPTTGMGSKSPAM